MNAEYLYVLLNAGLQYSIKKCVEKNLLTHAEFKKHFDKFCEEAFEHYNKVKD